MPIRQSALIQSNRIPAARCVFIISSANSKYAFLKSCFRAKIDFALNYLLLLYTKPTQRLPILLLESKEKGTGKVYLAIY